MKERHFEVRMAIDGLDGNGIQCGLYRCQDGFLDFFNILKTLRCIKEWLKCSYFEFSLSYILFRQESRNSIVHQLCKPFEMLQIYSVLVRCVTNEEKQFPCSFMVKQF